MILVIVRIPHTTTLINNPDRIVQKARSPKILALYDNETGQARELGISDSPTFAVDREIFWGDDHLEDAVSWYRHGPLA